MLSSDWSTSCGPRMSLRSMTEDDRTQLFNQVRDLIRTSRQIATRTIDAVHVMTNFMIGRMIVEHEQGGSDRAEYGKQTLEHLSRQLTAEFRRGYSVRNLREMRRFYLAYQERLPQIRQNCSAELPAPTFPLDEGPLSVGDVSTQIAAMFPNGRSPFTLRWSMYVFLLAVESTDERSFYEIEATQNQWTLAELKRQFNSGLFERLALSRDRDEVQRLSREGQVVEQPRDLIKDPYVLEFLGLSEHSAYSESDLESAIIDRLEQFLLELGKGFLFEARQRRFTFNATHYFVDLVFYNRLLHCYVLIDLKIGEITHQDLGQMQMYVNYFDREVKQDEEHPTIGILLCKMKDDAMVELTLPEDANIYASEYQLYLPSKEQLRERLLQWYAQSSTRLLPPDNAGES